MNNITTDIKTNPMPTHVAIIMDGNGRWAKAKNLDRSEGHVKGVDTVRLITEEASRLGIKYLTLYTFSTENWNRPVEEVNLLMHLIVTAIERETPDLIKNNVKLTMIGDKESIPAYSLERLEQCMADTAHCSGLTLCLAISYSSRWEITRAARRLAAMAATGQIDADSISDKDISDNLATVGMPDPELIIRTGGDLRLSNFLLWQAAYSEIYVTETYWPDFSAKDFEDAIKQYMTRERRFGLTSEQLK
ncbi:MAG: isoprenyl transferase [Muribaculaceae bacterium]|nr:isoprenyl transferase [Muribaculaceae bacterium]MDE5857925.1 isoprenyl transferase [Muribaculaceae bacterium]MDE7155295.1 isoprenyl transferase [Muribaculaceae bacterium]MDE7368162.1 isoprenyl transferase [Muribaculaceae bacterium]